jgi:hypothetical protein
MFFICSTCLRISIHHKLSTCIHNHSQTAISNFPLLWNHWPLSSVRSMDKSWNMMGHFPKSASKSISVLDVLGWSVPSSLWKAAGTDPVQQNCSVRSLLRAVCHSRHRNWTNMKMHVIMCYRLAMGNASWWWNFFLLRQRIWRYHLILVT